MPVTPRRGSGEGLIWLTGGALALCLLLVLGLVAILAVHGLGFFWPARLVRFELRDGTRVLGAVTEVEEGPSGRRFQVRQGNRDAYGADFRWVDEAAVARREEPRDAAVVERREWGPMIGTVRGLTRRDGRRVEEGADLWDALRGELRQVQRILAEARGLERGEIGEANRQEERARLALRRLELKGIREGPEVEAARARREEARRAFAEAAERLKEVRSRLGGALRVEVEGVGLREVPLAEVVEVYRPNAMGLVRKAGFYVGRVWEFLTDEPREANTEGGIFPALFGTVLMVLLMSVFVSPLGVLAALYLREYARQGPAVSAVRIAVNNLAGVPSIVFGVFGVGFFIYTVGGTIDRLFYPEALPSPTFGTGGLLWASLTLALLTVPVVIVATEEGLAAIPRGIREASLALGATKWETTRRVVLPALVPSILTGLILAMARAAGEVAPLMITGVVKLAPSLPVDGTPPYLHLERKFMHLGFHIYDVGFQSPNVEAARPMVFATAFLLLAVVVALNLAAIVVRQKLRRRLSAASW